MTPALRIERPAALVALLAAVGIGLSTGLLIGGIAGKASAPEPLQQHPCTLPSIITAGEPNHDRGA